MLRVPLVLFYLFFTLFGIQGGNAGSDKTVDCITTIRPLDMTLSDQVEACTAALQHEGEKVFDQKIRSMLDSVLYTVRGRLLGEAGKFDAAEQDFQAALDLTPGRAMVLFERGEMRLKAGKASEALPDFDVAIEKAREVGDAIVEIIGRYDRGLALEQLGRKAEAEEAFAYLKKHYPWVSDKLGKLR